MKARYGTGSTDVAAASVEQVGWTGRIFSMVRMILGVSLGVALVGGAAGCHKTAAQSTAATATDQNAGDPADANMAQVGGGASAPTQPQTQVLGQRVQNEAQQQAEDYPQQQQAAPIERRAPSSGDQSGYNGAPDNSGAMSDADAAAVYESDLTDEQASDPPPPLADYEQPPAPDPDYLWTPGYWGWGPGGYYWVPGCWVAAPYAGALWTPGYWGFVGGYYRFHHGYWGLHIGFYGGVDYGYGYVGHGYYGGYWNGGHFFYNTAVNRVNVNVIRNVYVHNVVINNVTVNSRVVNRVSYNGGRGGVTARPMAAEVAVLHEQRIPPMASQVQVRQEAAQNKAQFYNENKGRPAVAVAAHPVVADHTLPAALPRATGPVGQPGAQPGGFRGETARPGQPQVAAPNQPGRPEPGPQMRNMPANARQGSEAPVVRGVPESRPLQPQEQARPVQPQPEARPVQPQQQGQPQGRQQPQFRQEPQQQAHPVQPQPQVRQQPQQQARPAEPQPQVRQAPPNAPARPAPEVRQAPQVQERRAPEPGPRAEPPRPQPQPQAHPAPPPPAPRPEQHEEKPRSR